MMNILTRACWSFWIVVLVQACSAFSVQPVCPVWKDGIATSEATKTNRFFSIEKKIWDGFGNHHVSYDEASRVCPTTGMKFEEDKRKEPILLLNGFGVGTFHQHRLMPEILQNEDRLVYGMDYLGQGSSWPKDCDDGNSPNEKGLIYSADTWADQVIQFIEDVIQPKHDEATKVHLIGNSVGGYISVVVARRRPDLVSSLCLLNATPIWGLNAPGWTGHLPPPSIPRRVGRYLFDRIRDLNTIEKYLVAAYSSKQAFNKALMNQIHGCTLGNGGHAAFASILWSPPATFPGESQDWFQNLEEVQCDVLLMFGAEDPWCRPAFAKRMIKELHKRQQMGVCRYLELSNVGHCPNHEAPRAVGTAVSKWVASNDRSLDSLAFTASTDGESFSEEWADITMCEKHMDDIRVSLVDRLAVTFV